MIPPFEDSGFLPPGIHPATLQEIAERFGNTSELRRVQMESIRWMAEVAIRAGVKRIVLNGSFTTDTINPNDVDCVLLFDPQSDPDSQARRELRQVWPFLEMAIVEQAGFDHLVTRVFSSDRLQREKGMIEVAL